MFLLVVGDLPSLDMSDVPGVNDALFQAVGLFNLSEMNYSNAVVFARPRRQTNQEALIVVGAGSETKGGDHSVHRFLEDAQGIIQIVNILAFAAHLTGDEHVDVHVEAMVSSA